MTTAIDRKALPRFWFSVFDGRYHRRRKCGLMVMKPQYGWHAHYVSEHLDDPRRGARLYKPCERCV